MRSRRKFLKLLALSSAAVIAPAAVPRRSRVAIQRRGRPAVGGTPALRRSAAIEAEIRKQVKATAGILKTIRAYDLPPGSEMAFAFAPVRPTRRRAAPSGRPPVKRSAP